MSQSKQKTVRLEHTIAMGTKSIDGGGCFVVMISAAVTFFLAQNWGCICF